MSNPCRVPIPLKVAGMAFDCHHVIEASAGTGKTYLLEHRVVDLIIRAKVPLHKILVVTFTEKATEEIRVRIRQKLMDILAVQEHQIAPEEPHWAVDQDVRALILDALAHFESAHIMTIHGFCQSVLSEEKFERGRLLTESSAPPFSVFRDAVTQCLRHTLSTDAELIPYLKAYLDSLTSSKDPRDDLTQLLKDVARAGGEIRPKLDPKGLRDALSTLDRLLKNTPPEEFVKEAFSNGSTRKAVIKHLTSLGPVLSSLESPIPTILGALAECNLKYLVEKDSDHPAWAVIHDAVSRVYQLAIPIRGAVAQMFYPHVALETETRKNSLGVFDFDDMLSRLSDALLAPTGRRLAASLGQRFPHALIDEFQDTDPIQWSIFKTIYLSPNRQECFVSLIGDPKQAIYGFRGADLQTYFEAKKEVLDAGGALVTLDTNFRSTSPMVQSYNTLLATGESFFSGEVDYDNPVVPGLTGSCEGPAIYLQRIEGEDLKVPVVRARHIDAVASEIEALLNASGSKDAPDICAADIFVLTRGWSDANLCADALRHLGIPCALFQSDDLFKSQEAREVRDLFAAIASPYSESCRMHAWRTRFFNAELRELKSLRDADDSHPWVSTLLTFHELAHSGRVAELFSSIWHQTTLIEAEILAGRGQRSIENIHHIFETLSHKVWKHPNPLAEIGRLLSKWISDANQDADVDKETQRLEGERDAVQIMTLHKSKGLEADVIFLLGMLSPPQAKAMSTFVEDNKRVAWMGRKDPTKAALSTELTQGEDERLLYVGLTRARKRLYLPFIPEDTFRVKGNYKLINDRLLALENQNAFGELFELSVPQEFEPKERQPLTLNLLPTPASLAFVPKTSYLHRAGEQSVSYTSLSRSHQSGDVPFERPVATASSAPSALGGGADVGILLHTILENIDMESADDEEDAQTWTSREDVSEVFKRAMPTHCEAAKNEAAALVHQTLRLKLPLADGGTLEGACRALNFAREMEFMFPDPTSNRFMTGVIDLVFEHDRRWYVLDWKSDILLDYSEASLTARVNEHYSTQARIYGAALVRLLERSGSADLNESFGGVIYVFMRGPAAHFQRPDPAELKTLSIESLRASA